MMEVRKRTRARGCRACPAGGCLRRAARRAASTLINMIVTDIKLVIFPYLNTFSGSIPAMCIINRANKNI